MTVQKNGLLSNKMDKFLFVYFNELEKLTVREYAEKSGVSKSSVSTYLAEWDLLKSDSLGYKLHKSVFEIKRIISSGLLDFIVEKMQPSAIIIFGSMQKGDYTYSSDIDIFVESYEGEVSFASYEKVLGREIQLFVYDSISKVPKDLRQNIVNGYTIYGGVRV